jgi:hypothetical protein
MPNCRAASRDRSMIRFPTNGPRSLTRTTSFRPLSRLVTSTIEGSGRVVCAADTWFMSKISPLAVALRWNASPYQEATPRTS